LATLTRTLSIDKSVSNYGPHPNLGVCGNNRISAKWNYLKTGRASSISTGGKDSVDVYYDGNAFVIATAFNINTRATSFFVGTSTNLNDGVASPLVLNSG